MAVVTQLAEELRSQLVKNETLGGGNFVRLAKEANPARDAQIIWLEREARTAFGETYKGFSLSSLIHVADQYAAWYWGAGVREKDPVCVYMEDGIEYLYHYVALASLGAIPILLNGNMPAHIAAIFMKRAGAVGFYGDESHLAAIKPHLDTEPLRFVVTDENALDYGRGELPAWYPFQHEPHDPILIGHSSGTTGIPKAVIFDHAGFYYGVGTRLAMPSVPGAAKLLSALPHSHSAGLAYMMLALLNGNAIYVLTQHFGAPVLEAIEQFKPTMLAAFPETWVSITEQDMAKYDLSSIKQWVNGGDAAHETHIRKLIAHGTRMKEGKPDKGSIFIDGMGSSEMGFSLFRHIHTPDTNDYDRCVGTVVDWSDAQVLGPRGERLAPYQVGKLGVKGPSVTPGYWNDSLLTTKSRLRGYQLTGDLAYRDEAGRFYHVDRIPDAIRTSGGMVYSLQTEERLMKHFPEIIDCSVIAVPVDSEVSRALALVRFKADEAIEPEVWLERFNTVLERAGLRPVSAVVSSDRENIPLGSTGKVLKRELREHFRDFFSRRAPKRQVAAAQNAYA